MKLPTIPVLLLVAIAAGCRGETSRKPPIHLIQNMDFQDKLKPQSAATFEGWTDGRGMREPVHGTVASIAPNARTKAEIDAAFAARDKMRNYFSAIDAAGKKTYIAGNPLPKTKAVLDRGKERFEIHCAVCHGLSGRGDGIVARRLSVKPPSFHAKAAGDLEGSVYKPQVSDPSNKDFYSDAEIYDVITNGRSTMRPYGPQVDPSDRWAIVHYIRALQLRARN